MMSDTTQLRRAMIQQLESLQQSGLANLPKPAELDAAQLASIEEVNQPATEVSDSVQASHEPTLPTPTHEINEASVKDTIDTTKSVNVQNDSLTVIQAEVAACRLCDELAETRTQTVFGVGNPNARLVFLGEAPGADEDKQGIPFVGRAGQLLTKIIEACTLSRDDVYILNILKCRPPGNRNPTPNESSNCRKFLDRQLAAINPEYICCLGAVAAHNLLQTDTPIGRMRGKFYDYNGIQVMCTYHPAYLLRNPSAKKFTWEDMQQLMSEMGIELS